MFPEPPSLLHFPITDIMYDLYLESKMSDTTVVRCRCSHCAKITQIMDDNGTLLASHSYVECDGHSWCPGHHQSFKEYFNQYGDMIYPREREYNLDQLGVCPVCQTLHAMTTDRSGHLVMLPHVQFSHVACDGGGQSPAAIVPWRYRGNGMFLTHMTFDEIIASRLTTARSSATVSPVTK